MDTPAAPPIYCITVQGRLDEAWETWLSGLTIETADEHSACVTSLTGEIVDQAALRGLLNRLWDLNLTLITVTRLSR